MKGTLPGSVYAQHLLYMAERKTEVPDNIVCPRQQYGHDLKKLIEEQTNKGHQIFVCGNFNSEYSDLKDWMLEFSLEDLLAQKHEKRRGICNTYNVDIVCLTEINKYWRLVGQQHIIWNATASWRDNRRV